MLTQAEVEIQEFFDDCLDRGWSIPNAVKVAGYYARLTQRMANTTPEFWEMLSQ